MQLLKHITKDFPIVVQKNTATFTVVQLVLFRKQHCQQRVRILAEGVYASCQENTTHIELHHLFLSGVNKRKELS